MSTLSAVAAPVSPRGFIAKAGALAAGTAFAGATLFGGAAAVPMAVPGLTASVQHDYVLTANDVVTDFATSLQTLLDALHYGTIGEVLGLFGDDITTASSLGDLLAALNPDDTSLNAITLGLLSLPLTDLLNEVPFGTGDETLGSASIAELLQGFIGGAGADTTIGDLLGLFSMGEYAGLLNLPFLGLSPGDSLGDLLNDMLGINVNASINDLLTASDLGGDTIGGLLGIDPSQPWDEVISNITLGGTLTDPDGTSVLGDATLAGLLGSLLPDGSDAVTDATTLTDFLGDLGIFTMLGLG